MIYPFVIRVIINCKIYSWSSALKRCLSSSFVNFYTCCICCSNCYRLYLDPEKVLFISLLLWKPGTSLHRSVSKCYQGSGEALKFPRKRFFGAVWQPQNHETSPWYCYFYRFSCLVDDLLFAIHCSKYFCQQLSSIE